MKRLLEKMSLLALSLMLISSFSISSALPLMLKHFKSYSPDRVELLISVPAFFVIAMLLLNKQLNRYLKERQIIIIGLLTMSIAGLVPFFYHDYNIILLSRMFFGLGTGMINAKAISIISEYFQGHERVQMLGFRGSAEVVGSAFLTMLVGLFIRIDWYYAFLIYGFGFLILLAYLFFVPEKPEEALETVEATEANTAMLESQALPYLSEVSLENLVESNVEETEEGSIPESQDAGEESLESGTSLSVGILIRIILMAFVAGWTICINSAISLRIPIIVTNLGIGSPSDASFILMLQQLIGIVAGVTFAPLLEGLKQRLLSFAMLGLGIFLLGIALSARISPLGISAIGTGFFYSLIVTAIFYRLAELVPGVALNNATAMVLLGCNLGSALSPYILKILGVVSDTGLWLFSFFGLTCFLIGGMMLTYQKLSIEEDDEDEEELDEVSDEASDEEANEVANDEVPQEREIPVWLLKAKDKWQTVKEKIHQALIVPLKKMLRDFKTKLDSKKVKEIASSDEASGEEVPQERATPAWLLKIKNQWQAVKEKIHQVLIVPLKKISDGLKAKFASKQVEEMDASNESSENSSEQEETEKQ